MLVSQNQDVVIIILLFFEIRNNFKRNQDYKSAFCVKRTKKTVRQLTQKVFFSSLPLIVSNLFLAEIT